MKPSYWIPVLIAATFSLSVQASTIYLCKSYAGGMFWAGAHCNQYEALIERIAYVPSNLPFDQQVALGEQQRATAASALSSSTAAAQYVSNQNVANDRLAECKALDLQIRQWDSMARQPQSGQTQDWISAQRKKARDRQFQIRC